LPQPRFPELEDDTPRNNLLHSTKCGVYKTGHPGGQNGNPGYTVSQRRREIGIRLVLGAQGGDVLQMVLRQSAKMALVGVAIGIAAALGLTELMRSLLFGVSPHDPLSFAAVAGLLIVVALLASYIPARRAMLIDPVVALRYE
jgi:putative ABC transport system permease protein